MASENLQEASSGLADLEYNLQMAERKLGLPNWDDQPLSAARLLRIGVPPELVEAMEKHIEAVTASILRGEAISDSKPAEANALERLIVIVAAKAFS